MINATTRIAAPVTTSVPDGFVTLTGTSLTIADTVQVARGGAPVRLASDPAVLERISASWQYVSTAAAEGRPIYGVTSGFGGMSHIVISSEEAADLQNNAMWFHKAGAGRMLPLEDVRAAMLLRANSHMHGASGLRLELIERIVTFLNAGITPHVPELGSIGASGDLVPLTYIAGSVIGHDPCFTVDYCGETMPATQALALLGLPPLRLGPKEGLAMINGTSMMTGIAANCVHDAEVLLALTLGAHALALQGLRATNQSFHPFIHTLKPHPGQCWAASTMLALLEGSGLILDELNGQHNYREHDLIQDRYSIRCLPQYLGPIVDGLAQINRQITTEMNSATDNPLIDCHQTVSYHGGNFLGQYVGVGMDQLRYYIGLLSKHLDVQLSLLTTPEFNRGLPGSLVGNPARRVNMGLKGLQIVANSIMPLLMFLGNSLVDRFPTHAEQYNQNINSQGFGSANLARQAIQLFQQYLAIALMFGVQATDLRTHQLIGHYDARMLLAPSSRALYEAVRAVIGRAPAAQRPFVWNDDEQVFDVLIAQLASDIAADGQIVAAIQPTLGSLRSRTASYLV